MKFPDFRPDCKLMTVWVGGFNVQKWHCTFYSKECLA